MPQPTFSIVTVCLNPGEALHRTADSVRCQTSESWEYIVKDGVSSDGTNGLRWHDPRARFLSQPDLGIYDAMRQGLAHCTGLYIQFINVGDLLAAPDVLQSIAAFAAERGNPEIVYTWYECADSNARTKYPAQLGRFFLYHKSLCHQATFIRREVLDRHGGFDPGFRILADNDLLARLILVSKVRHACCPLVGVRVQAWGASATASGKAHKRREQRLIRRRYFSWGERLLFGALYVATLPGLRRRFFSGRRDSRVHRVYQAAANWFNVRS